MANKEWIKQELGNLKFDLDCKNLNCFGLLEFLSLLTITFWGIVWRRLSEPANVPGYDLLCYFYSSLVSDTVTSSQDDLKDKASIS